MGFGKKKGGEGQEARRACNFIRLETLRAEVDSDVAKAGYPGLSTELVDALGDRAASEVEAASTHPLDPGEARSDGWVLEERERCKLAAEAARANVEATRNEADQRERELAGVVRPMGILGWSGTVAVLALIVVAATATLGGFLTSSIDIYLVRGHIASVLDSDAEAFSFQISAYLAIGLSGLVVGGQAVAVLCTRGRIHWFWKLLIVLGEVVISGAFAIMRLGGEFSWQAMSISALELGIALLSTSLIMTIGGDLKKDAPLVVPWRLARARLRAAKDRLARAISEAEHSAATLARREADIAAREDAVRRRAAHEKLARTSTNAAYAVALAKLVGEAAANPNEEGFAREVESHLASEFERENERRRAHVE